jgi:hypothetical protein
MNQRPPKPDFLIQYEEWVKAGPPKCCHNCESYDEKGHCMHFDMAPPAEFAATPDSCDQWIQEITF